MRDRDDSTDATDEHHAGESSEANLLLVLIYQWRVTFENLRRLNTNKDVIDNFSNLKMI